MSGIPKAGEKPLDARGFLSPAWHRYLSGLSTVTVNLEGLQKAVEGKQDASASLSAIADLTTAGFLTRLGSGNVVTRYLTAGEGIAITNPAGKAGQPEIATDWPPFMARLSLGV